MLIPDTFGEVSYVSILKGSSDPDANSNVSKITRMIVEGIGLGWGETVFSGVTFRLVDPGLKNVVRLGYKNIIVVLNIINLRVPGDKREIKRVMQFEFILPI